LPWLNAISLVGCLIIGFILLIGLGWLLIGPMINGSLFQRKSETSSWQSLPLLIITGLMIDYGISLLFQTLSTSLIFSATAGTIGVIGLGFSYAKKENRIRLADTAFLKTFTAIILTVLFIFPIVSLPLSGWDARSIWFFHAKMIYSAGSIGQIAGWMDPAVVFSHPDYPNLVPALAAKIAFLSGFWNEYLPKISLIILLFPAIGVIITFCRRVGSFLFLLAVSLFTLNSFIWNGYMDGYLALYFGLAMLFIGRFFQKSKIDDLYSGLILLIFLVYIKNEGLLALITGLFILLVIQALRNLKIGIVTFFKRNMHGFLLTGILLIPLAVWIFYKNQWGLSNDLGIGSSTSLELMVTRLKDNSIKIIIARLANQLQTALLIVGLIYFATVIHNTHIHQGVFPILAISAIYCVGIILVYLQTPVDLAWHLQTSVERTMMLVNSGIYAAGFFLVENLETFRNPSDSTIPI